MLAGFTHSRDPLAAMYRYRFENRIDPSQIHVGITSAGRWVLTPAQTSMIALGESRSGKTTSVMAPAILAHPGPVIATSAKSDLHAMTALVRSRIGRIWRLDPAGSQNPLPGATELHWSPISCIETAQDAERVFNVLYETTIGGAATSSNEQFFRSGASELVVPLLMAARIAGRDIAWVREWLRPESIGRIGDIAGYLRAHGQGELAINLEDAAAVRHEAPGEFSGTLSTARAVLKPLMTAEARQFMSAPSENQPVFDMTSFVLGNLHTGADSIYFTIPASNAASAVPLMALFISQLVHTVARQSELSKQPNVLAALDEAANVLPLKDLLKWTTVSGGQGLCFLAGIQNLEVARVAWGASSTEGVLDSFQNIMQLSRVGQSTAGGFSAAAGEYDKTIFTHTRGTQSGTSSTDGTGTSGKKGQDKSTSSSRTTSSSSQHSVSETVQTTRLYNESAIVQGPQRPEAFYYRTQGGRYGMAPVLVTSAVHGDAWTRLITEEVVRVLTRDQHSRMVHPIPILDWRYLGDPAVFGRLAVACQRLSARAQSLLVEGEEVWAGWIQGPNGPLEAPGVPGLRTGLPAITVQDVPRLEGPDRAQDSEPSLG